MLFKNKINGKKRIDLKTENPKQKKKNEYNHRLQLGLIVGSDAVAAETKAVRQSEQKICENPPQYREQLSCESGGCEWRYS